MKYVPPILILLISLGTCLPLFSQNQSGNIGNQEFSHTKDSIHILLEYANTLIDTSPQKAYNIAEKVISTKKNIIIDADIALANKIKGEAKFNLNDFYKAKKHLNDAYEFYGKTNQKKLLSEVLFFLGRTHYSLSEYPDALGCYLRASDLFTELDNDSSLASTYQNIGLIYHDMSYFDKAEEYYLKALKINKTIQNKVDIAGLYQNLGSIKLRKGDIPAARVNYEKSLKIYQELDDQEGIGITYSNLGLIEFENKRYPKAKQYYIKALNTFKKINYNRGMIFALYNLGETYMHLDEFTESENSFKRSLRLSKKNNYSEGVVMNLQILSELYERNFAYEEALEYYKKYTETKDSLISKENEQKIAELESIHALESKEQEMSELIKENQRQKTHKTALLIIIALACLIIVITIISYIQTRTAKKELENHKNNLEKLVEKRTSELRLEITERKIAEESDKLKSAFLANMSHELRTPMNAIIAFSNFLREKTLSDDKKNEYINHIHSAGESLLCLIDDIIDSAKIEAKQLTINKHTTDITRLLTELYEIHSEIKHKHENVKLKLTCDRENHLIIHTDSMRLKQVINNLIENAFKYTLNGEIEFGLKEKEGGLEFFVSDTGIGVPEDKIETIFHRFSQVEYSPEKAFGGTGLGLAISRDLVHLLGGKIWVESVVDKGSDFRFFLPVEHIEKIPFLHEKSKYRQESIPEYNWKEKVILIAEDEELNYKVLDSTLSKTKAKIIRASDGEQAVEHCKKTKVDLVLMDIQMPKKDGYAATAEIKAIFPDLPIIAQTSFAMDGEKEKCLRAGCDDYLSKPLDINKLKRKISDYFMT